MMTLYVFTGTGWLNGERWLRHWMVGNGVESECVCGAGWVLVCVCVGGGGGGGAELNDIDDDLVCYVFTGAGCAMSWMTVYFDSDGRWLGHWMVGNGGESECVCGAGWVLVRSVNCVCVGGGGGGWGQWWVLTELDDNDDDLVCVHWGWVYNELDDCILTYWWEVVASLDG